MLKFVFTLASSSHEGEHSGFELGDIEVSGTNASVRSAGLVPSRASMIYLAIVELLDGFTRLCASSSSDLYQFVATDSSFSLIFQKDEAGYIVVRSGKVLIATVTVAEACAALSSSTALFLDAPGHTLSSSSPVRRDLSDARLELDALERQLG